MVERGLKVVETGCVVYDGYDYIHGKFNIAPEHVPSQKDSSLPTIIFQGRAVKLRGCGFDSSEDCIIARFRCVSRESSSYYPP